MSWDWKSIVKTAAPMLGTALGGPLGGIAGKLLANALGGDPTKTTPDDLAKLVQNVTPEQLLALKSAEEQFQLQMAELNIKSVQDLEALAASDRDSARKREEIVRDHTTAIGFYFTTLGFFGLLTLLIFHAAPSESRDLLNIMLGALGLAWGNEVKYYYGGAAGDDKISEMLHKSTPTDGGAK